MKYIEVYKKLLEMTRNGKKKTDFIDFLILCFGAKCVEIGGYYEVCAVNGDCLEVMIDFSDEGDVSAMYVVLDHIVYAEVVFIGDAFGDIFVVHDEYWEQDGVLSLTKPPINEWLSEECQTQCE